MNQRELIEQEALQILQIESDKMSCEVGQLKCVLKEKTNLVHGISERMKMIRRSLDTMTHQLAILTILEKTR